MHLIGAAIAVILAILLLVYTAHFLLHVIAWILIAAAIFALISYFVGRNRNRSTRL